VRQRESGCGKEGGREIGESGCGKEGGREIGESVN